MSPLIVHDNSPISFQFPLSQNSQNNSQNSQNENNPSNNENNKEEKNDNNEKKVSSNDIRKGIRLKGFTIYAFPTWSSSCEDIFPAMLKYTGNPQDEAIAYRYTTADSHNCSGLLGNSPYSKTLEPIPTLRGTFYHPSKKLIAEKKMIRIDDGDYEKSKDSLAFYSMLMIMSRSSPLKPRLRDKESLALTIKSEWRLNGSDVNLAVRCLIAEVQKALMFLEILPSNIPIDGIMGHETIKAIGKFVGNPAGSFAISPKLFDSIITAMQRKQKSK